MSECTWCVRNTEPANYTYVCKNHHSTPVHESCITPMRYCQICNDKILGLLQYTYKPQDIESKKVFLSDEMLRRAKVQYKAWHLSRLHKSRQKSMQDASAMEILSQGVYFKTYFSEQFGCVDVEPLPSYPPHTDPYGKLWEDFAVNEKVDFRKQKQEIKTWFSDKFWDTPKCNWCEYDVQDDPTYKVDACLPITICDFCNIGLCQSHLDMLYTKKEWNKLLHFGSPREAKLMTFCQADGCTVNFCKYRLFEDHDQKFDLHHDGPHGATPIARTCLMQHIDNDETGSLICEVKGCKGHAFCSFECKKTHMRICGNARCRKAFHVTKKTYEEYPACPECESNE